MPFYNIIHYMKMSKCYPMILVSLLLALGITNAFSQNRITHKKGKASLNIIKSDSLPELNKLQPYDKVITAEAKSFKGIFTISKVKNKYYFEIPDSILDRDFLVSSYLKKGPAIFPRPTEGFAGEILGNTQISFSKGPNNKLFIKRLVYDEIANDSTDNGLHRSLKMNDIQPIMFAFNIVTNGQNTTVIDVTDFLNSDLSIISGNVKKLFMATAFQSDKSYIDTIQVFPMNIEVTGTKTYIVDQSAFTTEINTSFVLLPKKAMQIRYADERIGYNSQLRTNFDMDSQRGKIIERITRWRLEPKAEDLERYMKGELVEPIKPIVFYIDPTTPKKWVPYIVKAVNDWQPAFEQAGFKNAIYAKEATMNDTSRNPKDSRFNTIVYVPSMTSGIFHNLTIDPRSGEILQANILINHNTLAVLHDTYMMQTSAVDRRARNVEYSTELMGELLRVALSVHVGNCLGLLENAGASSTVSVAKLRDKGWVVKHGISPSIMQGAMFNYVAQPEDRIPEAGLLAHVGEYDKWAISFGYRCFPKINNSIAERDYLRKIIADSLRVKSQLYYGAAPKENELASDPRNQSDDLGDNAIEASSLGIKNLKYILPHLRQWTAQPDKLYATNGQFGISFYHLIEQFDNYLRNVANIFGTYYYNPHGTESKEQVYKPVSIGQQRKSMAFLKTEVFDKVPRWIVSDSIINICLDLPYNNTVYSLGTDMLNSLLDLKRLKKINATAERFGGNNTYDLISYLTDLDSCIWPELGTSRKVSSYHMVLQKMYITAIATIIDTPRDITNTIVVAISRGHLIDLKQKVISSLKLVKGQNSSDHYRDILAQINKLIDPKRVIPASVNSQIPQQGQKNVQEVTHFWEKKSVQY
jgi:hypothetical protein